MARFKPPLCGFSCAEISGKEAFAPMNDTFMKTKPVFPLLVSMALPNVISMLVNSLYNIVDSLFVAQINEQAMTALSLVFPIQNFVSAVAIGFGIGINALVALYRGAGDHDRADAAATHGMALSVLHGILCTLAATAIMPGFLARFTADGTIEAAEVREGDPAPDGSGPLHLARGIEIGHIFELGRKYSQALGLTVLDENGKARVVTMGSYGIGVSRVMAALAEANHDDKGLTWPVQIAPYHVQVLATGKDQAVFDVAEQIASSLDAVGVEVLYDDRRKVSAGVKFADAELLGLPYTLVVGRDLAKEGTVEIRDRRTGERRSVPADAAAAELSSTVRAALEAARH